jgi:hypothetical protein
MTRSEKLAEKITLLEAKLLGLKFNNKRTESDVVALENEIKDLKAQRLEGVTVEKLEMGLEILKDRRSQAATVGDFFELNAIETFMAQARQDLADLKAIGA